ncbi:MAG: hypothetical protein ACXW1Z_25655 [Methylobacter sp.]
MTIKTHLILISAQAVPNITPVLDETFKPRQVIMLVSPDMHPRADWLEQVINKRGVKTGGCLLMKPRGFMSMAAGLSSMFTVCASTSRNKPAYRTLRAAYKWIACIKTR